MYIVAKLLKTRDKGKHSKKHPEKKRHSTKQKIKWIPQQNG